MIDSILTKPEFIELDENEVVAINQDQIFEAGERAGHMDWFNGRVYGGFGFDFSRDNSQKLHNGLLNFDALQFVKNNEELLLKGDPIAFGELINIAKLDTKDGDEKWNEKIESYNKSLESKLSWQFHSNDTDQMSAWINFILGAKPTDASVERRGFINNNENWGNAAVQLYDLFKNDTDGLKKYREETEKFLESKSIENKMRVFESSKNGLLLQTLLDRFRFWGDRTHKSVTTDKSKDISNDLNEKLSKLRLLTGLSSVATSDQNEAEGDSHKIYFQIANLYKDNLDKFRSELEVMSDSQELGNLVTSLRTEIEAGDNPPIVEFAFMYEIAQILENYIKAQPNAFNFSAVTQVYDNLVNYSIDLDANLGVIDVVEGFISVGKE